MVETCSVRKLAPLRVRGGFTLPGAPGCMYSIRLRTKARVEMNRIGPLSK